MNWETENSNNSVFYKSEGNYGTYKFEVFNKTSIYDIRLNDKEFSYFSKILDYKNPKKLIKALNKFDNRPFIFYIDNTWIDDDDFYKIASKDIDILHFRNFEESFIRLYKNGSRESISIKMEVK